MHHSLGEPLPHQQANAPRVHPEVIAEPSFKLKPCGFNYYTVLASVSRCYPLLLGRLPTCYSPVRHSLRVKIFISTSTSKSINGSSFDLHVLGTPPAFILSQDQTLILKYESFIMLINCLFCELTSHNVFSLIFRFARPHTIDCQNFV